MVLKNYSNSWFLVRNVTFTEWCSEHLFPGLKKQLKGRHLSSDAEVIAAAETWLDGQVSEFF